MVAETKLTSRASLIANCKMESRSSSVFAMTIVVLYIRGRYVQMIALKTVPWCALFDSNRYMLYTRDCTTSTNDMQFRFGVFTDIVGALTQPVP